MPRRAGAPKGKCCTLGRRRSLLYSTTPPAAHAREVALRLTVVHPPCTWGRNHKSPVTEPDRFGSQNCKPVRTPGTPGPYQVLRPWAHSEKGTGAFTLLSLCGQQKAPPRSPCGLGPNQGTYVQKGALHIYLFATIPRIRYPRYPLWCRCTGLALVHPHC